MRETDWVKLIIKRLEIDIQSISKNLKVEDGKKLPYAYEIIQYNEGGEVEKFKQMKYETDILIREFENENEWKPRMIIECKIKSVSTHDSITYSQKSKTHKNIHPYLRYGILIGKRDAYPLPGRLFRHGENFDFMISFKNYEPELEEWKSFVEIVKKEITASRQLEEIIFNSRSKDRQKYTILHRPLILE